MLPPLFIFSQSFQFLPSFSKLMTSFLRLKSALVDAIFDHQSYKPTTLFERVANHVPFLLKLVFDYKEKDSNLPQLNTLCRKSILHY
jgi:hypothetical protein